MGLENLEHRVKGLEQEMARIEAEIKQHESDTDKIDGDLSLLKDRILPHRLRARSTSFGTATGRQSRFMKKRSGKRGSSSFEIGSWIRQRKNAENWPNGLTGPWMRPPCSTRS
jgi:hypothetical protein